MHMDNQKSAHLLFSINRSNPFKTEGQVSGILVAMVTISTIK